MARASIVYDSECPFCIRQIERIRGMDRDSQFDYVARQVPDLDQRFPQLKEMDFEEGMRLVDSSGHIFVGADAVYQIARRLPATRYLSWLYNLPVLKQLAGLIYKWIAANRKRLGRTCEDGLCKTDSQAGRG